VCLQRHGIPPFLSSAVVESVRGRTGGSRGEEGVGGDVGGLGGRKGGGVGGCVGGLGGGNIFLRSWISLLGGEEGVGAVERGLGGGNGDAERVVGGFGGGNVFSSSWISLLGGETDSTALVSADALQRAFKIVQAEVNLGNC